MNGLVFVLLLPLALVLAITLFDGLTALLARLLFRREEPRDDQ